MSRSEHSTPPTQEPLLAQPQGANYATAVVEIPQEIKGTIFDRDKWNNIFFKKERRMDGISSPTSSEKSEGSAVGDQEGDINKKALLDFILRVTKKTEAGTAFYHYLTSTLPAISFEFPSKIESSDPTKLSRGRFETNQLTLKMLELFMMENAKTRWLDPNALTIRMICLLVSLGILTVGFLIGTILIYTMTDIDVFFNTPSPPGHLSTSASAASEPVTHDATYLMLFILFVANASLSFFYLIKFLIPVLINWYKASDDYPPIICGKTSFTDEQKPAIQAELDASNLQTYMSDAQKKGPEFVYAYKLYLMAYIHSFQIKIKERKPEGAATCILERKQSIFAPLAIREENAARSVIVPIPATPLYTPMNVKSTTLI